MCIVKSGTTRSKKGLPVSFPRQRVSVRKSDASTRTRNLMEKVYKCKYVVVAGGGSKAASYLGILKALEAQGGERWKAHCCETVVGFAGSSAGSIVALCLCLSLTSTEMREVVDPILSNVSSIVPRPDISALVNDYGLDRGEAIVEMLEGIMRKGGVAETTTFDRLYQLTRKEFCCTGFNLNTSSSVAFTRHTHAGMRVIDAVRISTSVPLLFSPVCVDGDLYIDGALGCNIPQSYPSDQTMVWYLEDPVRLEIQGWPDYAHSVLQASMAVQRPMQNAYLKECAFVVLVRMPDHILNGPGLNLNQTTSVSEQLVSCGYASFCNAVTQGGLYRALAGIITSSTTAQQCGSMMSS